MRIAIRDDDTNFFTTPEEIEGVYAPIWDICPPSLSLVTHIKGNWKKWIAAIYQYGKDIDWSAWWQDNEAHPIGANAALVRALNEWRKDGRADLSFHGISHRHDEWKDPRQAAGNYILGAEFYTQNDKTEAVRQALAYLGKIFDYDVTVFTPPQNMLSQQGYKAIVNNRLHLNGGGLSILARTRNGLYTKALLQYGVFKIRHRGHEFPHQLHLGGHNEIVSYYPLYPTTQLQRVKEEIDFIHTVNGNFILSTHYHEMDRGLQHHPGKTLHDGLLELIAYAAQKPGVQFCSISSICS